MTKYLWKKGKDGGQEELGEEMKWLTMVSQSLLCGNTDEEINQIY